jgi:SNF2 family DNA or RNA helicase
LLSPVSTPTITVRKLYGGQTAQEREEIKRLMAPGGDPAASILVGTPQAGSSGLNFSAAHVAVYMTNSFSAKDRSQSEGRLNRPGQTHPVLFVDVLAQGPNGEKTIDHHIAAALRRKQDLSDLTASAWRALLTEE